MSAILKLDKMPKSCNSCIFKEYNEWHSRNCKFTGELVTEYTKSKHPQCPLQEGVVITKQQQTELLEDISIDKLIELASKFNFGSKEFRLIQKLGDLYNALGGS